MSYSSFNPGVAAGGSGAIAIKEDGVMVSPTTTELNFVGDGVTATTPSAGVVNARVWTPNVFNVKDYGAKGNTRTVFDANITTGTNVLTSATAAFTAADIGKTILVRRAGAARFSDYWPLDTTIQGVTNATTVTLAANASHTVANERADFGTNDWQAFNNCAWIAGWQGTEALEKSSVIYAPPGRYMLGTSNG